MRMDPTERFDCILDTAIGYARAVGVTVMVLGARAPIISGHMLNTLRIQSISDHNVSSGQKSDTFKMYSVM